MKKIIIAFLLGASIIILKAHGYEAILSMDTNLDDFYRKDHAQCKWVDDTNLQSTEYCYRTTSIPYDTQVCTTTLERVDHSEEIKQLEEKIKQLQSDYQKINSCKTVKANKEIKVLSTTRYIYKIVNKVKIVYQSFLIPKTGADY